MRRRRRLGPWLGTGSGSMSVVVSSSLNTFCAHKRYSTGLTIAEFKCKLELMVGSPASCMDLELYGAEEELLGRLDCDEALLGSYPVADGCRVHSPFGPSCASSVGDIMTLRGHGAGPRKQRWRPPSPSVPVAKSGYWDNPPNLPPCLWAKPTSSQATGWVSAMMSRWASMTAEPPPALPLLPLRGAPAGRPRLIKWRFKVEDGVLVSSPGSVMGSWPPASASSPMSRATPVMMLPTAFSSWGACAFPTGWAPTW